ncbi:MAG: hypothetical protein ACLGSH_18050 [Acidobacteriota bacterium]
MPLSSAYLCEDCHCVGNCAAQCPACASAALMCLAGILNRQPSTGTKQMNHPSPSHLGQVEATLAA